MAADLRASEVWYGREAEPAAEYADSAATPVRYATVVGPVPVIPATYERKPPPPPAAAVPVPVPVPVPAPAPAPARARAPDPAATYPPPRHVLPPYELVPERVAPIPPPPSPPPIRPPPPTEALAYVPPEGMVIPGVQHPDGRFEPHPLYVRPPPPPPVEVRPAAVVPGKHVVELDVPVCCEACEERVANYLGESKGVDRVDVDVETQKVTVVGDAAPADVLQMCKKCFRKSRLA